MKEEIFKFTREEREHLVYALRQLCFYELKKTDLSLNDKLERELGGF
jgi:hypothetical protein